MSLLFLMFLVGVAPCAVAWRLTRSLPPGRRATIRAACVSLFLVPALAAAPGLHGAFPVPAWVLLLWGPGEIGFGATMGALVFPPGIAFLVLSLLFRIRRSDEVEGITEKPRD